jgi:glycosyltransferase involved in cell wall biosynthesis
VTRIIGALLVRDDDLYVERAVRNVFGFCDELILIDNKSKDGTLAILERLAEESPIPTRLHRLDEAADSHALVSGYAGQDVWAFGLDGDELYDPRGLARFRELLLAGEYAEKWSLRGNVLHCVELDEERGLATGYLAPPAPSVTKMFNFRRIVSWDGDDNPERLCDPSGLVFKPGAAQEKYELNKDYSWEASPFRCLHVCFLRRSSRQRKPGARLNVSDRTAPRRAPVRAFRALREAAGFPPTGTYKHHYRVGDLVTVDVSDIVGRPAMAESA